MPGFIKVSGEQRPVAVPYIKVSGDWKPVAIGWVKVNGEWKIWHTAEIVDNFNRANSSTLGTASNDFSVWETLTGTWGISSNAAVAGTTAGPHLASVPLFKATTDVTVEVDIPSGTGVGAAFWVQNAQNWWAAIPGRRTQNNPSFYFCADSSYTLNGTQCVKNEETPIIVTSPTTQTGQATSFTRSFACCVNGGTLSGGNCVSTESVPPLESTSTSFTCPAGYSGPSDTNRCSTPRYRVFGSSTREIGCIPSADCLANPGGTCGSAPGCQSGGGSCWCTVTSTVCTGCGPDFTLACSNCSGNHIVFATATTITTRTCPSGYTRGQSIQGGSFTCVRTVARSTDTCTEPVFDCPPITDYTFVRNGTTCTYTARAPYCPSGFTQNGNLCNRTLYEAAVFVPASVSYPSVIRIQRSVGGTITTEFQQDISADPRSIQVSVNGNNVNVRSYATAGVAGAPFSSLTYTTVNAAKFTNVGVIKNGNQAVSQANVIDNFRAE